MPLACLMLPSVPALHAVPHLPSGNSNGLAYVYRADSSPLTHHFFTQFNAPNFTIVSTRSCEPLTDPSRDHQEPARANAAHLPAARPQISGRSSAARSRPRKPTTCLKVTPLRNDDLTR